MQSEIQVKEERLVRQEAQGYTEPHFVTRHLARLARIVFLWVGLAVATFVVIARLLEGVLVAATLFMNVTSDAWNELTIARLIAAAGGAALIATLLVLPDERRTKGTRR